MIFSPLVDHRPGSSWSWRGSWGSVGRRGSGVLWKTSAWTLVVPWLEGVGKVGSEG